METEALISLSHQKEQLFLSQQVDLRPIPAGNGLEIHSDGLSQICMASKYIISGCRKFAWP